MSGLVFVIILLLLYLSSLNVSQGLGRLIFSLTHNRHTTVYLLALLFLPGTFVHELAHLFAATILGVRTGTMELIPKIEDSHVVMGSVPIAQTDRIRRALIGAAPFFLGLGLLFLLSWWLTNFPTGWWEKILAVYLSFEIGNTCFASSRDMEGTLELVAVISVVLAALYFLGLPQPVSWLWSGYQSSLPVLSSLNQILLLPLGFNLLMLALINLAGR